MYSAADQFQRLRDIIAPPPETEAILWDALTMRQKMMVLRGCGLSPAESGYTYAALSVAERRQVRRLLEEWVGNAQRLADLQNQIRADKQAEYLRAIDGCDDELRELGIVRRERAA